MGDKLGDKMHRIRLKSIVFEDFLNYKKPSMFLITCFCDWKCCKEENFPYSICQNNKLIHQVNKEYNIEDIIKVYINNDITKAVVFGGLEPLMQYVELKDFIKQFREKCDDDVVIYTGYYKDEINALVNELKQFNNIIIKFGRYIPNHKEHFDKVLGVNLASDNQYAERIS